MARINQSRNIILSLKDYLEPLLTAQSYGFSFVSNWGSDQDIVLPSDYVSGSNQIKLPAGKFTVSSRSKGRYFEIGNTTMESLFFISLFIHAVSEGQALDLLDFLHDSIESGNGYTGDNRINIYDFSDTGYPSALATVEYIMEVREARHRYISDLGAQNIALKHAGDITFVGMLYVT
jgi:hypothetical protein